tara:strand:+ start:312 stop:656 length:345 start_codon:yes stop_codon:yes gene_type:complete
MKKASGFKMKNASIAKLAKDAGTPDQRKLARKAEYQGRLKRADKPTMKANITNKISKKAKDNRPKPPQPPKPGTIKGLTQFQYDMKPITGVGNKQLGKFRGKVRDAIKNYFFTK